MPAMTLVADAAHLPFALMPVHDAVSAWVKSIMAGDGKVQALHCDETRRFRTAERSLDLPAPLVLINYGHIEPWARVTAAQRQTPTRRVMLARDSWTCQYCGYQATPGSALKELTVDHVKPAHLFPSRAAATYWENITTACGPCNRRKGGLLPRDARDADGRMMLPKSTPKVPHFVQIRFAGRLAHPVQRDYVKDYFLKGRDDVCF